MTTTTSRTKSKSPDTGFQFHKDKTEVLLRAAIDMELDPNEIARDILKHLDFYIMASNAYLRSTCNDKAFADKTPMQALYDGRDVFVNMMQDYVKQYNENKSGFVKK